MTGPGSTSWTTPDARRAAPALGTPYVLPAEAPPSRVEAARAGATAAVVTVLLGAPIGLLWAALAPKVDVVLSADGVQLAEPGSSAFIAGDGYFLLAVLVAGVVGGLVAWRLGRAHGPAVIVGMTLGGLAAAYVAMRVGSTVGLDEVQRAVDTGKQGALELSLRLRSTEAIVGWPVGALVAYVAASLVRGR